MIKEILLVGTGGFAGSVLRYLVSVAMSSCAFPWGTFTVNASGSLIIGILLASVAPGGWHLLLIAGFCGGFTTFSAFSAQMFEMVREGNYATAALYMIASVAVCMAAVWMGVMLVKWLR